MDSVLNSARGTERMANPLASQLSIVSDERKAGVGQPTLADYRGGGNRLGSKMTNRYGILKDPGTTGTLSRLFDYPRGVISDMEKPSRRMLKDPTFMIDESKVNTLRTVNRHIEHISEVYPAIQQYELGILHKNNELESNIIHSDYNDLFIECTPQEVFTPEVFNYEIRTKQKEMKDTQEYAYRALSPSDIWKYYAFDGILWSDSKTKNIESAYSSTHFGESSKMATMNVAGPQWMHNYCGSSAFVGGRMVAIIKKFNTDTNYAMFRGHDILRTLTYDQKDIFRPYQIAFVCIADGMPLDINYKRYIDESNQKRYDSIVIDIGTIIAVPPNHVYQKIPADQLKPYNDTTRIQSGHKNSLIKIILNMSILY